MMMTTWHTKPRDQGQMIDIEWAATPAGAICRVTDLSEPKPARRYRLHRWLVGGEFEPWNGHCGCWQRGRRITEAEALRLLAEDGR